MTDEDIIKQIWIRTYKPCPKCGEYRLYWMPSRPRQAACSNMECRGQVAILVGTIMHKSATLPTKWVEAVKYIKAGGNALQLQKRIGVSYKAAWRMTKLIRAAGAHDPVVNVALGKRFRGPQTLEQAQHAAMLKV